MSPFLIINFMSDETPTPIIVDNGSGFIKSGMAEDDAPRSCIPAVIGKPKLPGMMVGMDQKDNYFGNQVLSKHGVLDLSYPIENGVIVDFENMEKIWHHIFYSQLHVIPQECPVLLTETPCNLKEKRQKMMEIMFQKFQVLSFYLAIQQVLALYASGKTTGIVVDSGDSVTATVPIYEGLALSHAIIKMNLAGKHLTQYLIRLCKDDGIIFSAIDQLAKQYARDTKQKKCYVATDFEGALKEFNDSSSKAVTHRLPDGNQITLRNQLIRCPEALFQPNKLAGKQLQGIHQSTFQSILKCDTDIRKDLYDNIIISGGTTMFKSIKMRLYKEVVALAPSTMNINVIDPPERKFSVWMGGSILASLSSFSPMFITKSQYQQSGVSYVHRKCF